MAKNIPTDPSTTEAPVGVFITGEDLSILCMDSVAQSLLGLTSDPGQKLFLKDLLDSTSQEFLSIHNINEFKTLILTAQCSPHIKISLTQTNQQTRIGKVIHINQDSDSMVGPIASHDPAGPYHVLINNLSVGVFRTLQSQPGQFLEVNQAMLKFFDAETREQLLNTPPSHIYKNPKDRIHIIEKLKKQGFIQNEEVPLVSLKGRNFVGKLTGVSFYNEEEQLLFDGILEDITHYKRLETVQHQAHSELNRRYEDQTTVLEKTNQMLRYELNQRQKIESELRISEKQYRAIVEEQTELICRINTSGDLTFVNEGFCRYFGVEKESLLGKRYHPELDPTSRKQLIQHYSGLSPENPTDTVEYALQHHEKGLRWLSWSTRVILDDNKHIAEYQSIGRDITTLKNAQLALVESENKFRQLAETASVAIFIIQSNQLIYVNPFFTQITGYNRDDIIGKPLNDILHPEHQELLQQQITDLLYSDDTYPRQEFMFSSKTGEIRWVDFSANRIEINGKLGIICTALDITERKKTEESIQTLSTAMQQSPAAVMITDPQGYVEYVNPKFCQISGFSSYELVGTQSEFFRTNSSLPDLTELLQNLNLGLEWHGEIQTKRKNGEPYWKSISISPVRDDQNRIRHVVAISEDITERKQMEEALRNSEEKNRALINAIPDMILRINSDGIILDYKSSHGSSNKKDHVGDHLLSLFSQPIVEQIQSYILKAFRHHQIQVFEYQQTKGHKTSDFEARLVVSSGKEILVIIRNITERKKIDRLKNEFISTVSHELRTPLTSIIGSLKLVMGGVTGTINPSTQDLLLRACRNSERLMILINDLLDLEKIESGKMQYHIVPMPLSNLVKQSLENNQPLAVKYGVSFKCINKLGVVSDTVMGDPERIHQVMTNLLSNAAKFSPPGKPINIIVDSTDVGIRVTVEDYGNGIPLEFRPHIFSKFAQADSSDTRQQGGTGLGLSICKAIIDHHQGQLGYESEPGKGTQFYFILPYPNHSAETKQTS